MKNLSPINDPKDIITKEYAEEHFHQNNGDGVLTVENESMGDVQVVLSRGTLANWRILNKYGVLHFQTDWDYSTNAKTDYHTVFKATVGGTGLEFSCFTTFSKSGVVLYDGAIGAASGTLAIANLAKYSLVWAYIDGVGVNGINFATTVMIPVSCLKNGNSVKLAGGIPSSSYITSSGVMATKETAGYITASMSTSSNNISLEISDGTIGNVQIISVI